ncbi:hypothetical protein [Flavobacterium sp.]|jgi:hypothetical protein|uniref:hypothetical protein n=1 Tax=Flavobacterium sp. TaxID=239 RepID=UPI0037BE5557
MAEQTNLLNWWESLDETWQNMFSTQIQLTATYLKIGVALEKELSDDERKLAEINENFEKNSSDLKNIALKKLILIDEIIIGRATKFILNNLKPLSLMTNLESIRFNNCQIEDLKSLEDLKNLKKIEFNNVTIYGNTSTIFSKINDIEILFEKSSIQLSK